MTKTLLSTTGLLMLLGLIAGCRAGPVAPKTVSSPDGDIVLDPLLRRAVGVPENRQPVATTTADGRMKFVFHLQNQTSEELRLQYQAGFYDAAGTPVDSQGTQYAFLQPAEIQLFEVTSTSSKAKRALVQVRPAR